jgi:hypothetical protein
MQGEREKDPLEKRNKRSFENSLVTKVTPHVIEFLLVYSIHIHNIITCNT